MTGVTGHGPWPGTDVVEAQSLVVGSLTEVPSEVTGMPFAVQLGARGPAADATGRAVAQLVDLPVELGAHGWKLSDGRGRDGARAQSLLGEDLDALAIAALGYAGPLVVPVTGPLTLAARLYLARGDLVLSDVGALHELAESFAAGVGEHLAAVRRAVPGAEVRLLVHEPELERVLAGTVRSFSGYSALRSVPGPVAVERLGALVDATRAAGAVAVVVAAGAGRSALTTVGSARADALAVPVTGLGDAAWERLAESHERGTGLWLDLPDASSAAPGGDRGAGDPGPADRGRSSRGGPERGRPSAGSDVPATADLVVRPWRRVGLPLVGLRDVVLLPAPPTAATTPDEARAALGRTIRVAQVVAERAEG